MDNDKQGFRRRMRVFLNSVEAANEIFTVYLCTSSDAQSSKRRWAEADWPNHHDATALKGRI
jgi:hypothetical protein